MNKPSNCRTCATMRCCPEHCCNWDDCSCKDCEMCGGSAPLEYSKKEIEDMETQKKEQERQKIEEENQRVKRLKEEAKRKKEEEEAEKQETFKKAALEDALKAEAKREEQEKIAKKANEDYLKTMAMINETQQRNQSTLDRLNNTINKLGATITGIQETNANFDKFNDDFSRTIAKLVESFGSQLTAPHRKKPGKDEEHMTPRICSVNDVVDEVAGKSHIVVLTGAGLSVASNLPTFRGEGGFWTLKNKKDKMAATEFLTHKYFTQNPDEIWRWHHEFRALGRKNAPNVSHYELANLQVFCKEHNRKFTLITQNIDGYHVDAVNQILNNNKEKANSKTDLDAKNKASVNGKPPSRKSSLNQDFEERKKSDPPVEIVKKPSHCDDIYEIHGSINYMRCDRDCTNNLFASPEIDCAEDFVPKCPNCQGNARPHTLFFDENYREEYYRGETILREIQSMDCLLVIGTQLETNLASGIVAQAIKFGVLIVEINPDPCIEYGNVRRLNGKAEEIVPTLCERLQKKLVDRLI